MPQTTRETLPNIATERTLTAERLAQYVARGRCPRHLRYALFPSEAQSLLRRYGLEAEPLSPLLSGAGQDFERALVEELSDRATLHDLRGHSPESFIAALQTQPAGRTFYYQPSLHAHLGGCACEGRADLIEVTRAASGEFEATVIDIKASARETVGFRLQVAFYVRLLEESLRETNLSITVVRGAIAARDSHLTEEGGWRTFDLALYADEIERLVAAPDSDAARAARAGAGEARYHLRAGCDGCPYNALCFTDTAEREDLSMIPLLSVSEKSALRAGGIGTARELARLMRFGAGGAMEVEPGSEQVVRKLNALWPLAGRLPELVQRSRAALNRFDRSITSRGYIVGSDYGSLPDSRKYPDLVRVFVDAQRDYLEDKLYLVAARIVGPGGASEVSEMTAAPPDAESERALLVGWVQRLLPEIARVAGGPSAPLHIYTYAPRGERALLEALTRHFDALCAVPAFYDLLTSHPALSQGMVSLLHEEVRARLNLSPVCWNLYEVAQSMGFVWHDGETDFRRTFRARIFDNKRVFVRDATTGLFGKVERKTEVEGEEAPPFVRVESAARFGAEIPLEYAYAAWGRLRETPSTKERERTQLKGFLGVGVEQLRAFAAHRTRAMQHVEESFAYKNRNVEKESLDLSRLHEVAAAPEEVPLSRSLEDFLLLEHHASFQEKLLHLSLPPRERAETGRTAILACERYEKTEERIERAWFGFACAEGEETASPVARRLRAGDWVVLNPLADEEGRALAAWKLVRGRLALVEELTAAGGRLRLLPMSFKNSPFRYPHRLFAPEAGALYTVDEMADDLNSDKFLEACRHAASNHLYRLLSGAGAEKRPRAVRPKRLRDARTFTSLAGEAQKPHGLNRAQQEIVGEHLTDRVLVVQGPPGTGKSHTLGFAILARALAQATPARPFRVAVLAKTHAAAGIALESVAKRAKQLRAAQEDGTLSNLKTAAPVHASETAATVQASETGATVQSSAATLLAPLAGLKIVKVCNDAGDPVPEGVERVLPDGGEELSAVELWETLLAESLLVVGGTPGGLFRLVKQGASKGRAINWTGEYFDLVVVDEASQMGLAEALTASAFMREDGQFIAVGDHRQMPPILAHAWDRESRRDLKRARPFLSVFEYLQALGFPRAALEESFRIPSEIADFLGRHIYAEDGINFRSTNRVRLPVAAVVDEEWLRAVLAPEHAMIVVEHDEAGSQQSNEFEAALVEKIVTAASEQLGLDAARGLGVVVPHRAQKALLAARLPALADSIDTVERFQGGERDLIIVSATVSDREFAEGESDFLLEPRRLTVAVSRPKRKLIVIASQAVFDLIPADLDEYERGALWKHLRHDSKAATLWTGEVGGTRIAVRAVS